MTDGLNRDSMSFRQCTSESHDHRWRNGTWSFSKASTGMSRPEKSVPTVISRVSHSSRTGLQFNLPVRRLCPLLCDTARVFSASGDVAVALSSVRRRLAMPMSRTGCHLPVRVPVVLQMLSCQSNRALVQGILIDVAVGFSGELADSMVHRRLLFGSGVAQHPSASSDRSRLPVFRTFTVSPSSAMRRRCDVMMS